MGHQIALGCRMSHGRSHRIGPSCLMSRRPGPTGQVKSANTKRCSGGMWHLPFQKSATCRDLQPVWARTDAGYRNGPLTETWCNPVAVTVEVTVAGIVTVTTVAISYEELAHRAGISLLSARRISHRHKWRKIRGNDGRTLVHVPVEYLEKRDADSQKPVISTVIPTADATVTPTV